jgi:bifunctional DNA-binding transcriptional regulator/antitoxin component of YhaV-PrlF toxin-antitoxin module
MHHMAAILTSRVSNRGQTSLPASLRHRWGIAEGGVVAFVDLGGAALVLPGGVDAAKDELRRVLLNGGAYEDALADLSDPDLADQPNQ